MLSASSFEGESRRQRKQTTQSAFPLWSVDTWQVSLPPNTIKTATGGAAVVCGSPHQFFSKRYAAPCIPSIAADSSLEGKHARKLLSQNSNITYNGDGFFRKTNVCRVQRNRFQQERWNASLRQMQHFHGCNVQNFKYNSLNLLFPIFQHSY